VASAAIHGLGVKVQETLARTGGMGH